MLYDYSIASAFSKNGSGGNKAGIVHGGFKWDTHRKISIATELNFSETIFYSDSQKGDFKLEYFTPNGEVPLCGHATIAFFVYMLENDRIGAGHFMIETKAGTFGINVEKDGTIFMQQTKPKFLSYVPLNMLKDCFHPFIPDKNISPRIVSTGLCDILMPIATAEALNLMEANTSAISSVSKQTDCVGIHAFALRSETDEEKCTAVCRNFAPLYGIEEESATGTSNCALACYLHSLGIRPEKYIFEQGRNLSCESLIEVRLETNGDEILSVKVGGKGYVLK